MARIENLSDFLTDVAAAIKQKTGKEASLPASDFDKEILSIETVGEYQEKTMTISTNGNYRITADEEYDALAQLDIEVNVPKDIVLQEKLVEQNGVYVPDGGYDGFSKVQVAIPEKQFQNKEITITSNQTLDITPDEGYDGLAGVKAIVKVEGGGGDDPAVNSILWSILGFDQAIFNVLKRVIPIEQSFVAVGGTEEELYDVLVEIIEGGNVEYGNE